MLASPPRPKSFLEVDRRCTRLLSQGLLCRSRFRWSSCAHLATYDDAAIAQVMITRMLQLIHTLADGVAVTGAKCTLQTPGESLAFSFEANAVETV